MKQTIVQQSATYADLNFTTDIEKIKQQLIEHAELEGQHHAGRNICMPQTMHDFRSFMLAHIEAEIQGAINMVQAVFLPQSGMAVARQIHLNTQEKIGKVRSEVYDDRHLLLRFKREAKELQSVYRNKALLWFIYFCLILIPISEGWFSYGAFHVMQAGVLGSIACACGIAIIIGLGAHYLGKYIAKSKDETQKVIRYCVSLLPYLLVFSVLGCFRAELYNHVSQVAINDNAIATIAQSHIPAWSITLFSLVMFGFGLYFSTCIYRSKKEREQERQYSDICKEIEKAQVGIGAKEMEIERLEEEAIENAALALARYDFARSQENSLVAFAQLVAEKYKTKNLRFRADGRCPECFSEPIDFHFITYFNNQNTQKYEAA